MPDRGWCTVVMGEEDGARLMRLMRDAHGGRLPCQMGLRCPLQPRGEVEQDAPALRIA